MHRLQTGPAAAFGRRWGQRGGVMLEFAIALPLFLALLLAIVDFGSYFSDRMVVTGAAFNAARYRAQAPNCGSRIGVRGVVKQTVGDMVAKPDAVTIPADGYGQFGAGSLRRYTVTVRYERPAGLSLFTAGIAGFDAIEVSGLALCDSRCGTCQ